VAARVLSGEQPPKVPAAIRAFEQNCGTLDMGPTPSEVLPRTRVPYAPTAALAVRRTALQSIGGFDPALQIGEDVDLVWRLIEAGWRVRYQPSVTVTHVPRSSWPSWLRQRYIYGRSNAALAHRHPQNVVAVEATVGNVLPWLGVLWGGRRGAIFAGSTAILGALPLLHRLQLITTDPLPRAVTLQGLGIGYAGTALAQTIRRSWLPLGIVATAMKPRRAVVLVASFVVPASLRWFMDRPDIGLPAWIGVTAADDASYCAGQWVESIRRRSFRALRPSLTPLDRFFPTDIPTVS